MPAGKPNTQTRATDKYQKKVGLIVKGFKIKKEIAERYAKACEQAGVSQAAQITKMMHEFSNDVLGAEETRGGKGHEEI